jgi:hypothetical protein
MTHERTRVGRIAAEAALAALIMLASARCLPASAAADDDENVPDKDARWLLQLATVVDQHSGRGLAGSAGYSTSPATTWTLGANGSDTTSTSTSGLATSGIDFGYAHDFDHWGVNAAIGRWQDVDVLTARELNGGGEFRRDAWSVGPRLQVRRTTFDPINANTTVTVGGTPLPVVAIARCTLDNFGLGLRSAYDGETFGGHLDGAKYQYRDSSCHFDVTGLGALARDTRSELRQLLGPTADLLARNAARHIGSQNALLDSSFGGGASWRHEDLKLALDYVRARDFLVGLKSDTLSLTATADLGDSSGVDTTLGATRSATYGTIAFLEFAVRAHF